MTKYNWGSKAIPFLLFSHAKLHWNKCANNVFGTKVDQHVIKQRVILDINKLQD